MDLRTVVGPTDHITAPGSDYDQFLGNEYSARGKNYRIVQGSAAITSAAKLFVRGGINDSVGPPTNDGDPVVGQIPADISVTNTAASAIFCVITKGSVVAKKATTESFAAYARLEVATTGLVTAAAPASNAHVVGVALAAVAASVTSVATFISL